MITID